MPHVLMARVAVGEESVALGVWHGVKFGTEAPLLRGLKTSTT